MEFETLLAEISTAFINLPTDRIHAEIQNVQNLVCELLDIDRSSLWQVPEGEAKKLLLTHIDQPQEIPIPPEPRNAWELFPWTSQKVLGGETLKLSKLTDLPEEAERDRESYRVYGTKSCVVVPLSVGSGKPMGALTFAVTREERGWSQTMVRRFQLVAQIFTNALLREKADEKLRKSYAEITHLKDRLQLESDYLQSEIQSVGSYGEILGQSKGIREVLAKVEQVARTDAAVLVTGETGTGKELVARAIHHASNRQGRPMVSINCASLPPGLVESELFGRERGAYTGALTRQIGRFEVADGSTLFLDEIGELSRELQAKLLRVLEEGQFERLGSPKTHRVDVRLIVATHHDLSEEVHKGTFREDLYYRINVFPIEVPPLRERIEDVPLLVWAFVNEFSESMGKRIGTIPKKTMAALLDYPWPGNIRELRNVIEHGVILSPGDVLNVQLPRTKSVKRSHSLTRREMERQHILGVLEGTGWRIKGPNGAAEKLGLKPSTLYSSMNRLGIPTRQEKDGIST